MGKRRIIDSKIRTSQSFANFTYRQRDLWQGLIATADDQGRMPGTPAYIRSNIWPYDDISLQEITDDLNVIQAAGNIVIYTAGGGVYLQIVNWWKYQTSQWASPSDFPPPANWQDRARYHGKGHQLITTPSWSGPGGYILPSSNTTLPQDNSQDNSQDKGQDNDLSSLDKDEDKDKENHDEEVEKSGSNVFQLYEQEIGLLTPKISDALIDAEKEYPFEWVEKAITEAVNNNKRSWAYIAAILKRWKVEGFGSDSRPKNGNSKGKSTEPAGYPAIRKFLEKHDVKLD